MRGLFAELPEVARGADEPLAEVEHPHAVHHDTRRERVLGVGEPVRQRASRRPVVPAAGRCAGSFSGRTPSRTVRPPGAIASFGWSGSPRWWRNVLRNLARRFR